MAKAQFLLMPEWQGSSSSRAMQLVDGVAAIREDLPPSAVHEVAVPLEAGDAMGTPVARLSSVLQARDAAAKLLVSTEGLAITLGGDCASSLAGLDAAVALGRTAVLWFDAHADLDDPSTSPSGAAGSMTLTHALGDGCDDLASLTPVEPDLLTLVGARSLDEETEGEITRRGIQRIVAPGPADAEGFIAAVRHRIDALVSEQGATHLFIHVDLDVLDPAEFSAAHEASPFGLTTAELTGALRAATAALPLAGATICGFAPAHPSMAADDRPTVLRVIAALTSNGAESAGVSG